MTVTDDGGRGMAAVSPLPRRIDPVCLGRVRPGFRSATAVDYLRRRVQNDTLVDAFGRRVSND